MEQRTPLTGGALIAGILLAVAIPIVIVVGSLRILDELTTSATTTAAVSSPSTPPATAAPGRPAKPRPRPTHYRVARGDTLTGIATRLHLSGGWHTLYVANRATIGNDPNLLHVGTVLTVVDRGGITATGQRRYTVGWGDTLRAIASRFHVSGGWRTIYHVNRHAIGANPDRLEVGARLRLPADHLRSDSSRHRGSGTHERRPPAPASPNAGSTPARHVAAAAMPIWLRNVLLGVGLLIVVASVHDRVRQRRRRRHQPHHTERAPDGRPLIGLTSARAIEAESERQR